MFVSGAVVITFLAFCSHHHSYGQDCPSRNELQGSLKQVQKLLSAHEASYLQSLRNLKKKINLLQSNSGKQATKHSNTTCPKLDTLTNGRKLGKSHSIGHEVHFVCDPGFELVGSESRVCQESLTWSGQPPTCRVFVTMTNTSAATSPDTAAAAIVPAATTGLFVRPSQCTITQGTTHCTCEPGYTISGRDTNICTDIDECELFHNGQAGRLCLHTCINTPGGYRCSCPSGYNVTRDGRSCKDIDECANRQNNCTRDQMCINTYGGFQCIRVDCPKIPNASYIKTSPMRCERNPCPVDNKACSQAPNSFSYHYLAVVTNLSAPRVMFRVSALRPIGDTLRFSLLGGKLARRHFTVQRSDRLTGQLMLVSPVQGPATLEAEVEMTELERRVQLGRYITKVTMFVSQFDF
ncbi:fibulin-7 isoform X2 [Gouania willdenowi]|uniref:Fibulin-7-like n=1 Tax=Gouania willdenowi TaxID=441366 RepID=A0A8C5I6Y3_GOUWI|nr:fibulin-7-like isoform X2 [Gouania willdenowi]